MSASHPNSSEELLEKAAQIRALAETAHKASKDMIEAMGSYVLTYGFGAQYAMALQNGGMSPQIAESMASDLRQAFRLLNEHAMDLTEHAHDAKNETNTLEHIIRAGKHRARAGLQTFDTAFKL